MFRLLMPTLDPMPRNLLPNNLPRMNARTGHFHPALSINPDAKYANGSMYRHSHEYLPEELFILGLTEHIWFSHHNIEVSKMIPGIPDPYYDDCARGHALYVTGLSAKFTPGEVQTLFNACGNVKYIITLIDMNSGETFRWVVMGSFHDARNALMNRNNWVFGSTIMDVCYALPPGSAIPLLGRGINKILHQQHHELIQESDVFKGAVLECYRSKPAGYCDFFDKMVSARVAPAGTDGHTAHSPLVGYVPGDSTPEIRMTKLFNASIWSPSFLQHLCDRQAGDMAAAPGIFAGIISNHKSPMLAQTIVEETGNPVYAQRSVSPSGSDASTIVQFTARKDDVKTATAVTARPTTAVTTSPSLAAPALGAPDVPGVSVSPALVAAPSSWANIAALVANGSSGLVFDMHLESRSSSAAPRIAASINPNVIAHQQGESLEEQMRIVIILNLPHTITLQDVSDAITEGSVLTIHFATDTDNGHRYVGIVFQYAENAKAFREALIQEKRDRKPGRFKFIVDVGDESMLYPWDELLEDMEPPTNGSRRLTIVKKGFWYLITKKDLRKICTSIVGADKIQLIWFYNGGNASVVFADVKSAVAVKKKFDQMASIKASFGSNLASFEGVSTNFSRDPCLAPMSFFTDIPDHNRDA